LPKKLKNVGGRGLGGREEERVALALAEAGGLSVEWKSLGMQAVGLVVNLYTNRDAGKARSRKSKQLLRTGLFRPRRDLHENRCRISNLEWEPTILPQWRLPKHAVNILDRERNRPPWMLRSNSVYPAAERW